MANTREPLLQPIPILSLRPTQMTVGMREVKEKRKRWRERDKKKQAKALGKHMIPVVLGPDKCYYVVDHHHLARALHDEGVKHILVTVIADLTMVDGDAFWGVLDNKRWVYPYDAKGDRHHFKDVPKTVAELKDDPFRSLAGNCGAPVVTPRIRHRSANSCGRISCGGDYRARGWKPTSRRRLKRRWLWPRAKTRSICRAGADRHRTIEGS